MFLRYPLFISIVLFGSALLAQANYPTYASPLKEAPRVTGTFGELRSNHYHAGIDFKASTGTPVYAVGDGFVSRIKIQAGGYGQAIYIDHPEGYRSVYAHLSALTTPLMDTVRAAQRAGEQFELDLHFDPTVFPVKQGQQIGKVGNRGYSFGSHLHFEVRSVSNDAALNPLNFGIRVADSRPPQLRKLKVYEYSEARELVRTQSLDVVRKKDGSYTLPDTVKVMASEVAMGIKAFDRQNAMPNYNGPYALSIQRDSLITYAIRFDSIPFEETRCINAHTDYWEWNKNTSWFHRLYDLPGMSHPYMEIENAAKSPRGKPGKTENITIQVQDWSGNVSPLRFHLQYVSGSITTAPPRVTHYQLPWSQKSIIETEELWLEFPKGSLYENLKFTYASSLDTSRDVVSSVHYLHNELVPLHRSAQLRLQPTIAIPATLRSKVVLARCGAGGGQTSLGGAMEQDGTIKLLPISSLGTYCLMIDDQPPSIKPLSRMDNLGGKTRVQFKITDNFNTAGRARGLRYRAEIDGRWVLFEYDLKKDIIYHDFERALPSQGVNLRLVVTDDRNNAASWEGRLKR